jgi:hypothetical protein
VGCDRPNFSTIYLYLFARVSSQTGKIKTGDRFILSNSAPHSTILKSTQNIKKIFRRGEKLPKHCMHIWIKKKKRNFLGIFFCLNNIFYSQMEVDKMRKCLEFWSKLVKQITLKGKKKKKFIIYLLIQQIISHHWESTNERLEESIFCPCEFIHILSPFSTPVLFHGDDTMWIMILCASS